MSGNRANGEWDLEAAAEAAAREADLAPFAFAYKGTRYSVPHMKRWPAAALAALAAGNLAGALGSVLGEQEGQALLDAGLTIGELEVLFDRLAEDAGLGSLPNSGPPARRVTTRT